MNRIIKKMILCLLAVICVSVWSPTGITPMGTKNVVAASKNSDAKKLYKNYLKRKQVYLNLTTRAGNGLDRLSLKYYAMVDINKDGISELLITDTKPCFGVLNGLHIFTVWNNRVTYAGSTLHSYYPLRVNKKYGGVAVYHSGTGYGGESLISVKKGKVYQKKYIHGHEVIGDGTYYWKYYSGKKRITEKKYLQLRDKYTQKKKNLKYYKMKKN